MNRIAAIGMVVAMLTIGCQSTAAVSEAQPDSTSTLQARLDAMAPGSSLTLDGGVYSHGGVLLLRVPNVQIDGNGATLQATNDAKSSVQIVADGVQLTNITLTAPQSGPRMTGLDQHKLVIAGNDDSVSNIGIDGSAASGIFVNGAQNFAIRNVTVTNTRADGVHMTQGAGPGVVDGVTTRGTGDDAVAVVSYRDAKPTHDISISGVNVEGTRWGRGISVVGGVNVSVHDFTISSTSAAALYIATEGSPYFTLPVSGVTVRDGSIRQANQDADVVHGAILVAADNAGTAISDVSISNVDISGTSATAERNVAVVADGGSVDGITMSQLHVDDAALPAFFSDANPGAYRLDGWTVGGKSVNLG